MKRNTIILIASFAGAVVVLGTPGLHPLQAGLFGAIHGFAVASRFDSPDAMKALVFGIVLATMAGLIILLAR